MSSSVKRLPPYVLLITRVGGVGERAGGFLFGTNVAADLVCGPYSKIVG